MGSAYSLVVPLNSSATFGNSARVLRSILLASALITLIVSPIDAQATEIPSVVTEGLDLLIENKRTAAVAHWSRSWTDADTARSSTLIESLDDLDRLLGVVQGYDLVKSFEVGPSILNLYLIVRYEKQPLFAFFALYRPKSEWQVNAVSWNTDAAAVFPSSLLTPY